MDSRLERFAASAGFSGASEIVAIPGGANNQVFRVSHPRGRLLLKSYFQEGADSLERLNVEFNFSSFAWENGLRQAARPLARDEKSLLALYEFIEGRPCRKEDVSAAAVEQAARFVSALNGHKALPAARALSAARDACFSLADHFNLAAKRVESLRAAEGDAAQFVNSELTGFWEKLRKSQPPGAQPIAESQRCLSPSDFGFHNALLCEGGMFRFFDFEYAGWDDPAKMIADFFSQVAVPVPEKHFDLFCEEATRGMNPQDLQAVKDRARRVLSVHRVKWVCLLLNDFLPAVSERRRFALGVSAFEARKAGQLEKARRALAELEGGAWPI